MNAFSDPLKGRFAYIFEHRDKVSRYLREGKAFEDAVLDLKTDWAPGQASVG